MAVVGQESRASLPDLHAACSAASLSPPASSSRPPAAAPCLPADSQGVSSDSLEQKLGLLSLLRQRSDAHCARFLAELEAALAEVEAPAPSGGPPADSSGGAAPAEAAPAASRSTRCGWASVEGCWRGVPVSPSPPPQRRPAGPSGRQRERFLSRRSSRQRSARSATSGPLTLTSADPCAWVDALSAPRAATGPLLQAEDCGIVPSASYRSLEPSCDSRNSSGRHSEPAQLYLRNDMQLL